MPLAERGDPVTPAKPAGCLPDTPTAHLSLAASIRRHAEAGYLPNCTGSTWPTSDDAEERARAATELCPGCPIAAECHEAGQLETHHTWGGHDRTPDRPNHRTRQETTS